VVSNDQLSGATKLMPAAPVAVPAGWEFKPGDGVITVMTPGGGACTLYASGGGGVESMAYRMATMLATAPQPPAQSDHLVDANNMTQAAKVVVPAEWKMVPVDALTRWRSGPGRG
jgi:hypothetical protein